MACLDTYTSSHSVHYQQQIGYTVQVPMRYCLLFPSASDKRCGTVSIFWDSNARIIHMVRHITRRLAGIHQLLIARTVFFLLVILWCFLGLLLRFGLSHLLHKTLQTDSFEKTILLHLNFNGIKHLHIGYQ